MPHQCTNCGRTFADGSKEMLSGCPDCGGNKFQFRPASASESTPPDTASGSPPDAASGSPSERISDESPPTNSSDSNRGNASSPPSSTTQPSTDANSSETSATQPTESDAERDTGSWPDPATESDPDDLTAEGGLTDAAARAGAAVRDRLSRKHDDDPSTSNTSRTTDSPQTTDSSRTTDSPQTTDPDADSDTVAEDSAQTTARSDVVSREELSAAARDVDSDHPETPSGAEPPSAAAEDTTDTPSEDDHPDLSELRQELNDQFESIKIVSQGQYELNLMELYDRDEYIISLQEDGRYVIEVPDRWREGE